MVRGVDHFMALSHPWQLPCGQGGILLHWDFLSAIEPLEQNRHTWKKIISFTYPDSKIFASLLKAVEAETSFLF